MSGYASARRHRGTLQYRLPEPGYWELTIETTGASQDYSIDINAGSSVDITVDWGDGNAPVNYNTTGVKTCTYASAGTYSIKITGSIVGGNIRLNVAGVSQRLKSTGIIGGITGLTSFANTFYDCTGLTSLPADLFRYYPAIADYGFAGTFRGCTGLTSIPEYLFRYNVAVAYRAFYRTFYGCTGLASIPANLFRYNVAVGAEGFYQTFYGCNKLQLNAWIFYASGEEATRFASPVPTQDFTGCFMLSGAFTGTKGDAPALWDCTFNGAPTTTNCFTGHSAASVDNYGGIPTAWGGA
jgi:hypothetical protein